MPENSGKLITALTQELRIKEHHVFPPSGLLLSRASLPLSDLTDWLDSAESAANPPMAELIRSARRYDSNEYGEFFPMPDEERDSVLGFERIIHFLPASDSPEADLESASGSFADALVAEGWTLGQETTALATHSETTGVTSALIHQEVAMSGIHRLDDRQDPHCQDCRANASYRIQNAIPPISLEILAVERMAKEQERMYDYARMRALRTYG